MSDIAKGKSPTDKEHDGTMLITVINVRIAGLDGWIVCQNLHDVELALMEAGLEDDYWSEWETGAKVILEFDEVTKEYLDELEPFEGW